MGVTEDQLADRLRTARVASSLTQEDVARRLGLARSSVAQIELGRRSISGLELDRLAQLYGLDLANLLSPELDEVETSLFALFRAERDLGGQDALRDALCDCIALARELTRLEEELGLDPNQIQAPIYSLSASPGDKWQAIQQGERAAAEERRRLRLGSWKVGDPSELLESQGIRSVLVDLPGDVSGLTFMDPRLHAFIAVNRRHSSLRRRFSWIHEYAHVLLDRNRKGMLSRQANGNDLTEVRANAFAACFLMPEEGVREFVADLGKGSPGRDRRAIFGEAGTVLVEKRAEPGSQKLQLYDVVLLAQHFEVSRSTVLYRLRNLDLLAQPELEHFLGEEEAGRAKRLARGLGLADTEDEGRDGFRSRFLSLALEAYRRDKISRAKLQELSRQAGFLPADVDLLLLDAGWEEEAHAVSLPEGLG